MKYLKAVLWILTILFVGYYFFSIISKNWEQIINLQLVGSKVDLILLAVFAAMVYLVNSLSWHLITRALGLNLSYLNNLEIWTSSNASRFIPGAIWQYAGRVYLASEKGVTKTIATACLQIEGVFTLFAGAVVVLLIFHYWPLPINLPVNIISTLTLLMVTTFLLVFTNRKLLSIFSDLLKKVLKKDIYLDQAVLPLRWIPIILASFIFQFVVDGAVLFCLTRNLVAVPLNLYPIFIGIFAISWLIGYVSFFAPSGLGIQEVTMVGLLSFFLPIPLATVIAIMFRLVLLVSEMLTIMIVKAVVARSSSML